MADKQELQVSGVSRFDGAVKVDSIATTMVEAIAPLAGIGAGIQAAERAVVTAVATALWLTHGKHANREDCATVVGTLKLGMDSAGFPGSFASAASSLLGRVLRYSPDAPLTRSECIREADHMASFMFAQRTKRREEERAKREAAKKDKAAAEKAAKEQAKSEEPGGDVTDAVTIELPEFALFGGPDDCLKITADEFNALRDTLLAMRAATKAEQAEIRKADMAKQVGDNSWQAEAARLKVA